MFAQAVPCILCAFQVLHKLWSTLIKINNGNTRPPAWYVGKLPDEKLIIKELGHNVAWQMFSFCVTLLLSYLCHMISCHYYYDHLQYVITHVLYNYVMYNIVLVENEFDPILCVDRRDYVNGA